jgi:hypothetical protein
MNPEFFFMVNVILASRLVFLFRDGPLTVRSLMFLFIVQVVGLLAYQPGIAWAILLGLLLLNGFTFHRLEQRRIPNKGLRLLSLAVQILLVSVFFSPWIGISFNSGLFASMAGAERFSVLVSIFERICRPGTTVVLMGGLLVSNEANHLLRLLLAGLRVGPAAATGDSPDMTAANRSEYNTGRVIGILERLIVYGAVLTDQIAAIGLVLAVKGLARFKEMDDRPFAEYVLVGTLLSLLLAVFIASLVKSLI